MIGSSFGQQLAQYQTSFLVEEKILAAAATSVTFSNLNALRDGGYTIDILAISNTTGQPNINLIVNGDTNTANYTGRMMYSSSSSALGLATTNRISALAPAVGQLCASFTDVAFAGGKISAYTRVTDQFPEVYVVGTQYTPTVSNITSITIECATASGLAAGTIIRLYRKLNGNTAAFAPLQNNLVADIMVTSAATQVDITGLDSNLHGGYEIVTTIAPGVAGSIKCYINGDTNSGNYAGRRIYTSGSGTIGETVLQSLGSSDSQMAFGKIEVSPVTNNKVIMLNNFSYQGGGTEYVMYSSVRYGISITNITQLSLVGTGNAFGAGSRIQVFRRK